MPLTKSSGNMYPWVTHTHTHLAGECPHKCSYCYVQAIAKRFGNKRYTGPVSVVESEFDVKYGEGRTIFVEHMTDLFADEVPADVVLRVLRHCKNWPNNTYVFQTKNPRRLAWCWAPVLPEQSIVGTTIESNRWFPVTMGNAPDPLSRACGMIQLLKAAPALKRFVTIEPILDFDGMLWQWIQEIRPDFVNIGANSKGTGLPEPSADKVRKLIERIKGYGIEVREKNNLKRIIG